MSTPDDRDKSVLDSPIYGDYQLDGSYDEMFDDRQRLRQQYHALHLRLDELDAEELHRRQRYADSTFLSQGITFTVYGEAAGTERIFPYDLLPRIVTAAEWATIEGGLRQRIVALNLFLHDIYHEARILRDGLIPRELLYTCQHYRREMRGVDVPRGCYVSVAGDLRVRQRRTSCANRPD